MEISAILMLIIGFAGGLIYSRVQGIGSFSGFGFTNVEKGVSFSSGETWEETIDKITDILVENKECKKNKILIEAVSGLTFTRALNSNTTVNRDNLIASIKDDSVEEIIFFATHKNIPESNSTNLPLLCALSRTKNGYVLQDGNFLTAARRPRYFEIQDVFDEAEKSKKVSFCSVPVNLTEDLTCKDAVIYLLEQCKSNKIHFDPGSRKSFFALMSSFTEEEMRKS